MPFEDLRKSDVMAHLLDALEDEKDVGHYGRLVFAMVARHFMDEDTLVGILSKDPGFTADEARALYLQVQERDYNPPSRARLLEWQREQEFPLCPNPDDPRVCNLYRDLQFPEGVYEDIQEFYEDKAREREDNAA